MAINKNGVDDRTIEQAIAKALEEFYRSLLAKIDTINIKDIMKRKNPYLYRAKAMQSAAEIVENVLSATVSSSEETIFGNCFFEPIAIAASGGNKALAEGIDIMVEDRSENTIYAIAVKSGTSVFNADSKKRQEDNFAKAQRLAQQARARFEPVIGYSYGKKRSTGRGRPSIYRELAGQDFWSELTGDSEFYLKIIKYMGDKPEEYLEQYRQSYNKASNRLVKQFTTDFCDEDGSINWDKLVRFNSGYEDTSTDTAASSVTETAEVAESTNDSNAILVSLFGDIAAGHEHYMDEYAEGKIATDKHLLHPQDPDKYFYLRVTGDSMINADINDGDIVLVRRSSRPKDGDIVAAMINGDRATLKTLHRYNDHIELQPENPNYEPYIVSANDFRNGTACILGVVVKTFSPNEITIQL